MAVRVDSSGRVWLSNGASLGYIFNGNFSVPESGLAVWSKLITAQVHTANYVLKLL